MGGVSVDLYITLFIVFLLAGLATLIKYFGCEAMIAGYNTASPAEQKYIAEKGIGAFAGNYLYLLAGIILAGYLSKRAGFVWGVDLSWGLFVVIIIVMLFRIQRFNPPASLTTPQSLRAKKIGLGAGGIIVVVVAGIITWNALPAKFNLQADQLQITGAYGFILHYSVIEDIRLQPELPAVGMKTNGLNLGPILKGHFRVEGMGNARLFLRSYHGPVCIITLKGDADPVLINFSDPTETTLLFNTLNTHIN
jgi:hypothetical protein